jgi:hypothetical protein
MIEFTNLRLSRRELSIRRSDCCMKFVDSHVALARPLDAENVDGSQTIAKSDDILVRLRRFEQGFEREKTVRRRGNRQGKFRKPDVVRGTGIDFSLGEILCERLLQHLQRQRAKAL